MVLQGKDTLTSCTCPVCSIFTRQHLMRSCMGASDGSCSHRPTCPMTGRQESAFHEESSKTDCIPCNACRKQDMEYLYRLHGRTPLSICRHPSDFLKRFSTARLGQTTICWLDETKQGLQIFTEWRLTSCRLCNKNLPSTTPFFKVFCGLEHRRGTCGGWWRCGRVLRGNST